MRSQARCSYKSIAWLNGYDDATTGKLFDDSNQFCKDAYAAGFSKGKIIFSRSDFCEFLEWETWQNLVHGDNGTGTEKT